MGYEEALYLRSPNGSKTITVNDAGALLVDGASVGGNTAPSQVYAAAATGVAATDTAVLAAAVAAAPVGGTVLLDGHYKINAALTIPKSLRLVGRQKVTYSGLGALPSGPNALSQINGTMIEQTAAATDGIAVTVSGGAFHMEDISVGFSSGLATTGHGVNLDPGSNVVGVYGGSLDGIMVFGHDGNHYGLVRKNCLEVTTRDFRWSSGGGILDICAAGSINYGNTLDLHPYGVVSAAGTAHGYARSSAAGAAAPASGGMLNLMTYVRPQCNITGAAGAAGTQKPWSDSVGAGFPWYVTVISPDMEASGFTNPIDWGPGTEVIGSFYSTVDQLNTRVGYKALANAGQNTGTQHKSVAVGFSALAAVTTSPSNVAVGYFALAAAAGGNGVNVAVGYQALKLLTTGDSNTAVGANALSANLTGGSNTAIGTNALLNTTTSNNTAVGGGALQACLGGGQHVAVGAGAGQTGITTANYGTFIGCFSGSSGNFDAVTAIGNSAAGNAANTTALGKGAVAGAAGAVAIGIDNAGTGASTSTINVIALGTALHQIQVKNSTTGAGSAALGSNSPAVTNTAPFTWFKMMSSDGSTVYVPAWK